MLRVLAVLETAEGPLMSGEICRRAQVKGVDGNRALRRLVEKGMAERRKIDTPSPSLPWVPRLHKYYVYLLKKEYRPPR